MRRLTHRSVLIAAILAVAACSDVSNEPNTGGSGGTAGTGGTAGSGGTAGTGGSAGDIGGGGSGGSGGSVVGPKVSLTVTPPEVPTSGDDVEVVWVVSEAESCTASGSWSGFRNAAGGSEVRPIFGSRDFAITCSDAGGLSATDEATVLLTGSQLQVTINLNFYLVLTGDTFVVTVTVANPGDTAVSNVDTKLLIPENVIIVEADLPAGAACPDDDNNGECDPEDEIDFGMMDVDAGEVAEFFVMPKTGAVSGGETLRFRAEASSNGGPPANFTEAAEEGQSDLELTLDQIPNEPQAGDVLSYDLGYRNDGTETLQNVLVILTLPDHTTLAETPAGNVVISDGTVTWTIGTLSPNTSGVVEATANVDPLLPPGVPLRARAEGQATKNGETIRTRATQQVVVSSNQTGSGECEASSTFCANGQIDPIQACCTADAPPVQANACDGTESLANPVSCTAIGPTVTHQLTRLQIAGDCNVGLDLDDCAGVSCSRGGLSPGEGANGVDNALAGLAPVLAGVGGNLVGVNQLFSDAICGQTDAFGPNPDCETAIPALDLEFVIGTNQFESCANVTVRSGGLAVGTAILNLSNDGCVSGVLPDLPLNLGGTMGSMRNAAVRMTVSDQGFSDGLMGATLDSDTAVAIMEAVLEGSGAVVGQVFDISNDLTQDPERPCNALSGAFEIGGVAQ